MRKAMWTALLCLLLIGFAIMALAAPDDFEADAIGASPPSGWSNFYGPPGAFDIQAPNIGGNATHLMRSISGGGVLRGLAWDRANQPEDFDLQYDWWVDAGTYVSRTIIYFRYDGFGDGVAFDASTGPGSRGVALWSIVGGLSRTWRPIGADWTMTMPIQEWMKVRIKALGDIIQVKYWHLGNPEPATWNIIATDVQSHAGQLWMSVSSANPITQYFDNFSIIRPLGTSGTAFLSKMPLNRSDE